MIQYKIFTSIDGEVQLRRFSVDTGASFSGLKTTVAKVFQRELNGRDFQLFWKDEEEDFIRISTDIELQSLINTVPSTVRLYMKLIFERVRGIPKMGVWEYRKQQRPFQPRRSNIFNPSDTNMNPSQLFEDFMKALGSTKNNCVTREMKDDNNVHCDKIQPERATKADVKKSEMHNTSKAIEVTTRNERPVENQVDSETGEMVDGNQVDSETGEMVDGRRSNVELEKDVTDEQKFVSSSDPVVNESFVLIPEVASPGSEGKESVSPNQTENQISNKQTGIRTTRTSPSNTYRVASRLHLSTRIEPTETEEIVTTLQKLKSMGFSDDGGWLTSLVVNKHGVLDHVISALKPSVH